MLENIIIIIILIAIVGLAGFYVYKAKKSGKKCIGCPDSASCAARNKCEGCSGQCGNNKSE